MGQRSLHWSALGFSLLAATGLVCQEKEPMLISQASGRQPKQISLMLVSLSALAALLLLIPSLWGDYARIFLFTMSPVPGWLPASRPDVGWSQAIIAETSHQFHRLFFRISNLINKNPRPFQGKIEKNSAEQGHGGLFGFITAKRAEA